MVALVITAIIAYVIGSINFSVLISKKFAGFDVRDKGSGNAGTTNMLRNVGKKAAAITLVCDILKGVAAILIGLIISKIAKNTNGALILQVAGIAVVIGHTFPVFFEFKGGKGVATALGVILTMNWQVGLICLAFAIIIIAVTRMVSAGSVTAAVLYPILTIFGVKSASLMVGGNYTIFGIILALIVIFNHRENIKRIIEGKENKISFKK